MTLLPSLFLSLPPSPPSLPLSLSLPPSLSLSLSPSSLLPLPFSLPPFLPSFLSPPSSIPLQLNFFFCIFFVVAEVFVNGLRRQTSLTKLAQVCLCARRLYSLCAIVHTFTACSCTVHDMQHAHNMHTHLSF